MLRTFIFPLNEVLFTTLAASVCLKRDGGMEREREEGDRERKKKRVGPRERVRKRGEKERDIKINSVC